jgi:hypothetical protein
MAVWDEELWREFEALINSACPAVAVSKRARTHPIGLRLLVWIALVLLALLP